MSYQLLEPRLYEYLRGLRIGRIDVVQKMLARLEAVGYLMCHSYGKCETALQVQQRAVDSDSTVDR